MTFGNPIVAGEELIRSAIRSENYSAGVSGWRVARDGNAEFAQLTARGSVTSVGPDYTTFVANGVIRIQSNTDAQQLVDFRVDSIHFQPLTSDPDDLVANLAFQASIGIGFEIPGAFTRGIYMDQNTGFWTLASWFTGTREAWTALSAQNGYSGVSYKLHPDGTVMLDGLFSGGTASSPIVVGTLPAGYRPRSYGEYMVARNGAFGTNKLTIGTDGVITQYSNDAVYNSYGTGITFSTVA